MIILLKYKRRQKIITRKWDKNVQIQYLCQQFAIIFIKSLTTTGKLSRSCIIHQRQTLHNNLSLSFPLYLSAWPTHHGDECTVASLINMRVCPPVSLSQPKLVIYPSMPQNTPLSPLASTKLTLLLPSLLRRIGIVRVSSYLLH